MVEILENLEQLPSCPLAVFRPDDGRKWRVFVITLVDIQSNDRKTRGTKKFMLEDLLTLFPIIVHQSNQPFPGDVFLGSYTRLCYQPL